MVQTSDCFKSFCLLEPDRPFKAVLARRAFDGIPACCCIAFVASNAKGGHTCEWRTWRVQRKYMYMVSTALNGPDSFKTFWKLQIGS